VLTSVHAFAVDPTRGMFILIFLLLVVGGSLTLYAARATVIRSRARFTLWSREAFLLLNNLLLVIAMALVLLGTLYPLAYEAVSGGDKISVGVPYFNAGFVPLMLALAAALGIAPVLQWKRTRPERLVRSLGWILAASLLLGLAVPLLASGAVPWAAVPAVVVGLWVLGSHLNDLRKRVRLGLRRIPAAYWGMLTAHVGFAVALLGVALTSVMSVERDLRMSPGQVLEVSGLTVRFDGVGPHNGPNFIAERGSFVITEDGRDIVLHPEKRRYLAGDNVMTEAAISPGFTRDIYVSLGEPLGNGDWAVRVQHKPFVRWIWLGGLLMAFGGALAVADGRYRRLRRHAADAAADAAVEAGTAPSSSLPPGKAAEART
jgi:cytochrome c-type biogenesis protein CcmF